MTERVGQPPLQGRVGPLKSARALAPVPSALPPTLRKETREGRGRHCAVVSAEAWASPLNTHQ